MLGGKVLLFPFGKDETVVLDDFFDVLDAFAKVRALIGAGEQFFSKPPGSKSRP